MRKLLLLSFFCFPFLFNSQIIYVDIPDTTLTPVGGSFNYYMDLNNDGVYDFLINLSGDIQLGYIQLKANGANITNMALEADLSLGEAWKMTCQDSVNASSSVWNNLSGALPIITYLQGASFGSQFNGGVVDGYLGVMFMDTLSTVHYGWIRVDVPDTVMSLTIKDFAFTSSPNGILVCDMGNPCPNGILTLNMSSTNETVLGSNDGSAMVSVSGGVPPYTYLWSNSMTTPLIALLTPGYYSVVVTDFEGCSNSDSVYVNYGQPPVMVNDLNQNKISVYPNPFDQYLTVKNHLKSPTDITIYTANGAVLLRTQKNDINTSSFDSGVYLLRVKVGEEVSYFRLLKY